MILPPIKMFTQEFFLQNFIVFTDFVTIKYMNC